MQLETYLLVLTSNTVSILEFGLKT